MKQIVKVMAVAVLQCFDTVGWTARKDIRTVKILHQQFLGTGIRGLMRGMTTLPQGNKELLVVRDKVGRPPGELGVSKSMECDIFPFNALTLLVG